MRRAALLTLVLLILLGGSIYVAASDIYKENDQVVITEEVIYGHKEAVKDVEVKLHATYKDHLFWNTTYVPGKEEEIETKYAFFANCVLGKGEAEYEGVHLETMPADGEGIKVAYEELFDITEPGEERETEIYLKDYMDYYPINGMVELPGIFIKIRTSILHDISASELESDSQLSASELESDSQLYVTARFQEYFKIPILEEEKFRISVRKSEEGRIESTGGGSANSDSYYMSVYSKVTENACYFTIGTRTQEGKVIDTSHLPEGYGIYCLPYEKGHIENGNRVGGVDIDSLEMVYPLESGIRIASIETNEDETKLLLHAIENDKYNITVIDIETMETLQKLEVADWEEEQSGWTIYDEGDFMTILLYGGEKLAVVTLEDNGEYKLQFVCDVRKEEIPWFQYHRSAVDYDGERLVITGQLQDDEYGVRENTSNFYLAVYEETGIVYYGEYRTSLTTGTNFSSYSYHCRGVDDEPLEVEWLDKK